MSRVCKVAGWDERKQLADDLKSPSSCECFGLATDDVILFSQNSPSACERAASRLDRAFAEVGVERNCGKDVTGALNATVIGIDVVNGLAVQANGSKLRLLLPALLYALELGALAPIQLAALLGHIQWFNLLNRALFALLDACYAFARLTPQHVTILLPERVTSELASVLALAPQWHFQLEKPWLCQVLASDASPSFGFGVAVCKLPISRVRQLGALSEKRGDLITLFANDADADHGPDRLGVPHNIGISEDRFSTVISCQTKFGGHPGLLEAHAVRLALEWAARAVDRLGCRIVMLVDAKAVLGAVAKGRSSARTLKKVIARISALCMATDTTLHCLYVPSCHNPADAPSRGVAHKVRRVHKSHLKNAH